MIKTYLKSSISINLSLVKSFVVCIEGSNITQVIGETI